MDTQQKHARHSDLKMTLSYNRDQVGNSWARQAAIMNHTRNPALKMTNRGGENKEITQLSDFFDELDGNDLNPTDPVVDVTPSTVLVVKPTENVKSSVNLNVSTSPVSNLIDQRHIYKPLQH